MSVTLRKRKNADGTTSLFFDIYLRGKRTYEFLPELKLKKASTPEDRKYNSDMLKIAQEIQGTRMKEAANGLVNKSSITAVKWMENYIESYTKNDKRNMSGAAGRFKLFLEAKKKMGLLMREITETIAIDYRDFLIDGCEGEGAHSYFARFKKMIKQAVRDKVIQTNPCMDVRTPKGKARIKDTLTSEELQAVANTSTEAPNVKMAFLFSCMTGLRWADVKVLKWTNIDMKSNLIKLRQVKTGEDLVIQLNSSAVSILQKIDRSGDYVFTLPSANGANKSLQALVKRAEIEKKITWHCARHSFGTNLIFHGADVYSASKLLGHSSLKHTQRYVRAADELKQQAVNKLPEIKL